MTRRNRKPTVKRSSVTPVAIGRSTFNDIGNAFLKATEKQASIRTRDGGRVNARQVVLTAIREKMYGKWI